jgi:hypothetical protein
MNWQEIAVRHRAIAELYSILNVVVRVLVGLKIRSAFEVICEVLYKCSNLISFIRVYGRFLLLVI